MTKTIRAYKIQKAAEELFGKKLNALRKQVGDLEKRIVDLEKAEQSQPIGPTASGAIPPGGAILTDGGE
jgi:hypothetical protein